MLAVMTGLFVHIVELLTHMSGGPEKRNEKSADKPVQKVAQYEKDENIHGRQIYYRLSKYPVKKRWLFNQHFWEESNKSVKFAAEVVKQQEGNAIVPFFFSYG
jgi:hypothetical protein